MQPKHPDVSDSPEGALFKLPLELRDLVYSLSFEQGCYQLFQHGMRFDVHLGRTRGSTTRLKLPRWLLTCKQLLGEAMSQFYRDVGHANAWLVTDAPDLNIGLLQVHRLKDIRARYVVQVYTCTGQGRRKHIGKYPTNIDTRMSSQLTKCAVGLELIDAYNAPYSTSAYPRPLTHGCKAQRLSIWFNLESTSFSYAQFSDDMVPEVEYYFRFLASDNPLSEKIRFVLEEPVLVQSNFYPEPIHQDGEIVYSLLQNEITNLAIGIVSNSNVRGSPTMMRDWLGKEDYEDQQGSRTRHNWHLKVTLAGTDIDSVAERKYNGMQTFSYDNNDRYIRFGDGKEDSHGQITWESSDGSTKTARRPVWLDGLARCRPVAKEGMVEGRNKENL
jgi:hypothetical protein